MKRRYDVTNWYHLCIPMCIFQINKKEKQTWYKQTVFCHLDIFNILRSRITLFGYKPHNFTNHTFGKWVEVYSGHKSRSIMGQGTHTHTQMFYGQTNLPSRVGLLGLLYFYFLFIFLSLVTKKTPKAQKKILKIRLKKKKK